MKAKIKERFEKRRATYDHGTHTYFREVSVALNEPGDIVAATNALMKSCSIWNGLRLGRFSMSADKSPRSFSATLEYSDSPIVVPVNRVRIEP